MGTRPESRHSCVSQGTSSTTMKFLIIAALVAVASAQLKDDVFQFSNLKAATPVYSAAYSPLVANKYVVAKSASPLVAESVFTTQNKPILVKSIEQEIPTVYSQYNGPYNGQYYNGQYRFAQPALFNQYSQYNQQYKFAQPSLYSQYNQQYKFAQPSVYSQYNQQYKFAQPSVYSQYNQQYKFAQPSVFGQQYYVQPSINKYTAAQDSLSTYAAAYNGPQFRILSQTQEADPSGNYKVSYATENGIQSTEEGVLVNGSEGPVIASQGAYSYTGPDGVQYTVNWVADENGYRASGAHLPQAPAIPEEIQRSLAFNAQNPEKYDDQGRLLLAKK